MTFRLSLKELPFFLAYGIFLLVSLLSTSLFSKYIAGSRYSLVLLGCMGIAAVGEIFLSSTYNHKQQIALCITAASYGIVSYASGTLFTTIGVIPIFIFTGRRIDFNKIARFTFWVTLGMMIFIMLSAELHIIDNLQVTSRAGRKRDFLGFRFPLNSATLACNITALFVYYKKDHIKIKEMLLLLAFNIYLYVRTDSKLCFYSSVFILVLAFILKYKYEFMCRRKLLTGFLVGSYVLAFVVSLVFALSYDKNIQWMKELNRATEDRLYYANLSLERYGVTLFGEDIPWVGYGTDSSGKVVYYVHLAYFYVDNMYIQVMQRYGVVFITLFLALFTATIYKSRKNNDIYAVFILAIIAIKCVIDNLSFYLYYNTFWMLISYELLNDRHPITENQAVKKLLRMLGFKNKV